MKKQLVALAPLSGNLRRSRHERAGSGQLAEHRPQQRQRGRADPMILVLAQKQRALHDGRGGRWQQLRVGGQQLREPMQRLLA